MTRKDYKLIADAIASMPDSGTRKIVASALASAMARDNASFRKDLFLAACQDDEIESVSVVDFNDDATHIGALAVFDKAVCQKLGETK